MAIARKATTGLRRRASRGTRSGRDGGEAGGRGGQGVSKRTAGRMGARKRNAGAASMGTMALGVVLLLLGIGLTMGSQNSAEEGGGGRIYVGLIVVGFFTAASGLVGALRGKG